MTYVCNFFDPMASATVYGRRLKFFRAEHLAIAEGENWAYGPTLFETLLYIFKTLVFQKYLKAINHIIFVNICLMHFKALRLKCTQWSKGLSENESHLPPQYFSNSERKYIKHERVGIIFFKKKSIRT